MVASAYLNSGWTGGPYGIGKRMPIGLTRAMINAALESRLIKVSYTEPLTTYSNSASQIRAQACGRTSWILNRRGTILRPMAARHARSPKCSNRTSSVSRLQLLKVSRLLGRHQTGSVSLLPRVPGT
ncbi:MAG: phosphoenolpyruvate carboxykinase (ATP) [Trueperaceae bacterium]|nr:MAG: phosphoenolpyruvate carboxykinase (ATP) [Trueperaceae bacterium]